MVATDAACHHSFRHEALFYDGDDDLLAGLVHFVRNGVEREEPTLVVLGAAKNDALRDALGADAHQVHFADMAEIGANPARIIPAWQDFLTGHAVPGRGLRGVGEPIWADRSAPELAECQRHEALLNVCFSDPDFWLLCPYDTATLDDDVLDEARRTHPFLTSTAGDLHRSAYPGADAIAAGFDSPLAAPPAGAVVAPVDAGRLPALRDLVGAFAGRAGLDAEAIEDVVFVAHELATNSVRHAGGAGTLRLWQEPGAVICEVEDAGCIDDPLAGRVEPGLDAECGRGLWLANHLCDLVQIRSTPHGTVVRVHKRA